MGQAPFFESFNLRSKCTHEYKSDEKRKEQILHNPQKRQTQQEKDGKDDSLLGDFDFGGHTLDYSYSSIRVQE